MKSSRIYIAIIAVFLIVYLAAQYNKPKTIDWTESLDINDKIPFGTYVLYNRITDIFPGAKVETFREPVYNVINDHQINKGTYLIICNSVNLNEYDYGKLKLFISKGNNVFITASYFGDELYKELKIATSSEFRDSTGTRVKFVNSTLDTDKFYSVKKGMSDEYFESIDTAKAIVLGSNNYHHCNYVKYNLGKGHLYLNANPLMFTNYSLLNKDGTAYAATALSFVKKDTYVMWDRYYTLGREDDESTMRVFLRNPALRMAFYITLFSLIVYVLYQLKRRQRIIPVIEPVTNSTLGFVNVVGQVYYEQRDNSNIAQKQAAYFLEHIRTKYYLKTTVLNQEFAESLGQKSGVAPQLVQQILNQVTIIRSGIPISDDDLISFNQNIEQFYIQSK
jgi:hypothetical protein